MPLNVIRFDPTPNPDALKCILDGRLSTGPRSFLTPDDAGDDPVAVALFAIDGVRNILINGDWVTVGKHADAKWGPIRERVKKTLATIDPITERDR